MILPRRIMAIMVVTVMVCLPGLASAQKGPKGDRAKVVSPELKNPIPPVQTDWVQTRIQGGSSVFLTHSYLFQIMKGAAQQNQKRVEESVLIPVLEQLLRSLVQASDDADLRRLFGVPLAILTDSPGVELAPDVPAQAKEIRHDKMFAPRGHYTDSEALMRFFQAMQYLSKATIDVGIRPDAFPFPRHMLYPFETGVKAVALLSNPAHKKLFDQWKAIHVFYSQMNGPADGATFADMVQLADNQALSEDMVKSWAGEKGLPRINAERGVGIQPLGERSSLHQEVIDETKRKFMKDDTPRETIAEILRFTKLLSGPQQGGQRVEGLAERAKRSTQADYYSQALSALALGADGWRENKWARNLFASALTSLAEQTALMTKTSILVRKSPEAERPIGKGARLFLSKGSEKYLLGLGKASSAVLESCSQVRKAVGLQQPPRVKPVDATKLFNQLAEYAKNGKTVIPATDLWKRYGDLLGTLTRKPVVTVDVFQVRERSGKMFYYQWAIAPYAAKFAAPGSKAGVQGMETVFFEGWADAIIPGHDGPLNNLLWEGRVLEGGLGKIRSVLPLPNADRKD
ncbi:MAG: DUF3160 domain-containing protein [Thermodesulfobacteriota bacterium]